MQVPGGSGGRGGHRLHGLPGEQHQSHEHGDAYHGGWDMLAGGGWVRIVANGTDHWNVTQRRRADHEILSKANFVHDTHVLIT